jgi:hypothetical protein
MKRKRSLSAVYGREVQGGPSAWKGRRNAERSVAEGIRLVAGYRSWQTDGRENESAVGYWMGFCSSFERYKKLSEWSQIAPESSNQQRRRKGLRTALSSADPIVPEAEDWRHESTSVHRSTATSISQLVCTTSLGPLTSTLQNSS